MTQLINNKNYDLYLYTVSPALTSFHFISFHFFAPTAAKCFCIKKSPATTGSYFAGSSLIRLLTRASLLRLWKKATDCRRPNTIPPRSSWSGVMTRCRVESHLSLVQRFIMSPVVRVGRIVCTYKG